MPNRSRRGLDTPILLLLLGLLLFASPLMTWWASLDRPWYLPYLLWGLLIVAGAILQRRAPWPGEEHPIPRPPLTPDYQDKAALPVEQPAADRDKTAGSGDDRDARSKS